MKYIKSIFLIFVFIFSFTAINSVKAGWNENYPGTDCMSVGIMLSNQNGTQAGCNQYTTSVNAGTNDVVNVQLYFRNTSTNQTAYNTVGSITHNKVNATNYTFTGSLSSSLGGIGSQAVNLYIPANTRLVFTGAKLYQRTGIGSSPSLMQQITSTSALQNVSIGTVQPYTSCANGSSGDAFCFQGVVVASYKIEQDAVTTYVCNDGLDNDGDGYRDYPNDPGCSSYTDNDEYNYIAPSTYVCNDGLDNDGDGYRDYPNDPGCSSYTDNDEYNQVIVYNPTVTTFSPTLLTSNSGRLNGYVSGINSTSSIYFEWGTSETSLPNTTYVQSTSSASGYYETLRGLTTGITYYYRAVLKASNGNLYRGDIKSFRLVEGAQNPVIITPTPVRPTTTVVTAPVVTQTPDRGLVVGVGTNLVQLRYITDQFNTTNNGSFGTVNTVNNGAQNVCVDDQARFVVEYKNISNVTLANTILHIDIPKDVQFKSSAAGVYNKADNTITVNIGTLAPNQSGTVSFDGIVLDSAANRDLLVVPATLSFENPNNGARETAIAYGLATSQNCAKNSNLAGFAFGSGFFPTTLIGWLLLALIVTALIYLIRRWFFFAPVSRYDRRRVSEKHYEDLDVPTAPYHH